MTRPTSIWRPRGGLECVGIEQRDGVLAAVAGQVAVVLVDHREAGAREPGQIEDRDAGAKRKGRVGVAEIVGPTDRLDAGGDLCGPPVTGPKVVQVDVAAPCCGKERRAA